MKRGDRFEIIENSDVEISGIARYLHAMPDGKIVIKREEDGRVFKLDPSKVERYLVPIEEKRNIPFIERLHDENNPITKTILTVGASVHFIEALAQLRCDEANPDAKTYEHLGDAEKDKYRMMAFKTIELIYKFGYRLYPRS